MEAVIEGVNRMFIDFLGGNKELVSKFTSPKVQSLLREVIIPKRPLDAYGYFCRFVKEKGLKGNPIALWNDLSAEGKKSFEDLAEQKKGAYIRGLPRGTPKATREGRIQKKVQTVTRNKSAYMFFCQEMRPFAKEKCNNLRNPKVYGMEHLKDVMRELGRMWREDYPTPQQREKWAELAKKDKERYLASV
jgi:hypothetical protein